MKIGLVGLNQTGKTTVFNLLTGRRDTEIPGKTSSNTGIGFVPDKRIDFLSALYKPKKVSYAKIEFTDVPGFSATWGTQKSGAAKFLSDVRNCDALVYVLRAFEADTLPTERGVINPFADLEVLESELLLADLVMLERRIERIKTSKKIGKDLADELILLQQLFEYLDGGSSINDKTDLPEKEQNILRQLSFLTAKPRMTAVNQDENQFKSKKYPYMAELSAECDRLGIPILELCAAMELEISALPEDDKILFMDDLGLTEPGIAVLARVAYGILGYISFFTVGEDEVKAWTVEKGIQAKHAAGKIHTDMEKGFIKAEVAKYTDVEELGSMSKVKEKGLFRLEGKDYVVIDGDIISFRFN